MATCQDCVYFGKNGTMDWCYHYLHNYSTSYYNPACNFFQMFTETKHFLDVKCFA